MTVDIDGSTTDFDSTVWDSEHQSIIRDFEEYSSRPEAQFGFCKLIQKRISKQPVSSETFVYLGEYFLSIGDIEQAEKSFSRAIQLDRFNRDAWIGFATILEKKKELEKSMKIWRALRYSCQTSVKDIFCTLLFELALEV
ncbi:MAG: hypothetical protein BAJATHORv1_30269 [Candidatus Thorarchaeota archaeon]|nr:MAG: hypothetical protein BAJATHORv1_30269 [Candidatus Thorarchaeota archaeon]